MQAMSPYMSPDMNSIASGSMMGQRWEKLIVVTFQWSEIRFFSVTTTKEISNLMLMVIPSKIQRVWTAISLQMATTMELTIPWLIWMTLSILWIHWTPWKSHLMNRWESNEALKISSS
jgi:hypothetical protein